jgi:DNA-3-methyladenine glycosylase
VVTGPEGKASAVLIRAIEPTFGAERMREGAPPALPEHKLASGPGRVCRALAIDRTLYGADLSSGPVRILAGARSRRVERGVRVGLTRDDERQWRFWTDSRSVSSRPRRTRA